jgi:hypothetical protein
MHLRSIVTRSFVKKEGEMVKLSMSLLYLFLVFAVVLDGHAELLIFVRKWWS